MPGPLGGSAAPSGAGYPKLPHNAQKWVLAGPASLETWVSLLWSFHWTPVGAAGTGTGQGSSHRRTQKSFFRCSTGIILFLYQTQSSPKPCCPNSDFNSLYQLGCRQSKESTWRRFEFLIFSSQRFTEETHTWAIGIACYLLNSTLPSLAAHPHRLIPVGPSSFLFGVHGWICCEQVSLGVSVPAIHLWIKKPEYRWEMGLILHCML